jgi:phosphomannomutase / phosphoglucomutase
VNKKIKILIFDMDAVLIPASKNSFQERPGIRYLLGELKEKYKLALLSDAATAQFEDLKKRHDILKTFDAVFVSKDSGILKPDPIAQISKRFKAKADQLLFISEKKTNSSIQVVQSDNIVKLASEMKTILKLQFGDPLHIFRSYDIRGIYGLDLNEDVAFKIGKTVGTYIGKGKTITLSMDYRNGGPKLKAAFKSGALSTGINVVDIGITPTPVFYFAIIKGNFDGGTMITASHNPPIWNGFKTCRENAIVISGGHGMEDLKEIFADKKFNKKSGGKNKFYKTAVQDYTDHILKNVKLSRPLKVVLDPGNGTWCKIAKNVFEELGCKVIEINGTPDSAFSARGPDPNRYALEQLKTAVVKNSADFGAAFDADGDRASFVDDKGQYVGTADIVTPLFVSYLFKNKIKNAKVVYDVPCSNAIDDVVKSLGGTAVQASTGHASMIRKMTEVNAIFGAESSNHIYFPENFNIDDGVYAAVKMAELISNQKNSLSYLISTIPVYPTVPMKEIYCPDEAKFKVVKALRKKFDTLEFDKIIDIDGIKAFKDNGWVLIRASNTTPIIRVNSEGKTAAVAKKLFDIANDMVVEEIQKTLA